MTIDELRTELHEQLAGIRPAVTAEIDAAVNELEETILGVQAQLENVSNTLDAIVKSVAKLEKQIR